MIEILYKNYTKVLVLLLVITLVFSFCIRNQVNSASVATMDTVVSDDEVVDAVEVASEDIPYIEAYGSAEVNYTEDEENSEIIEIDAEYAYNLIVDEFQKLQNKDVDTITKYFGLSDIFTPETVSDRIVASKLTCMSFEAQEDGSYIVNVHICTLEYNAMNKDFNELKEDKDDDESKRIVANNLLDSKYDIHYNIPISIVNGEIVVSEYFKHAITGGWYTGVGVELEPVDCELN